MAGFHWVASDVVSAGRLFIHVCFLMNGASEMCVLPNWGPWFDRVEFLSASTDLESCKDSSSDPLSLGLFGTTPESRICRVTPHCDTAIYTFCASFAPLEHGRWRHLRATFASTVTSEPPQPGVLKNIFWVSNRSKCTSVSVATGKASERILNHEASW